MTGGWDIRSVLLTAALLWLAACAGPATGDIDNRSGIDHDISTTLPSADQNLRANPPGRPYPVESPVGPVRF
jgi:hypothetical protein